MPKTATPPSLKLNPHGVWEIRWSEDRRSMRKSTGAADRAAAELALAAFLQSRSARAAGAPLTVGLALDDYLKEHVEHGPVVDKERQRAASRLRRAAHGRTPCVGPHAGEIRRRGEHRGRGDKA